MANLLASNNMGTFVKLDARSLLKHKIRFARVCVRVDITKPLLKYAEIVRTVVVPVAMFCGMKIFLLVVLSVEMTIIALRSVLYCTLLRKMLELGYLRILKRNGWPNSLKMLQGKLSLSLELSKLM